MGRKLDQLGNGLERTQRGQQLPPRMRAIAKSGGEGHDLLPRANAQPQQKRHRPVTQTGIFAHGQPEMPCDAGQIGPRNATVELCEAKGEIIVFLLGLIGIRRTDQQNPGQVLRQCAKCPGQFLVGHGAKIIQPVVRGVIMTYRATRQAGNVTRNKVQIRRAKPPRTGRDAPADMVISHRMTQHRCQYRQIDPALACPIRQRTLVRQGKGRRAMMRRGAFPRGRDIRGRVMHLVIARDLKFARRHAVGGIMQAPDHIMRIASGGRDMTQPGGLGTRQAGEVQLFIAVSGVDMANVIKFDPADAADQRLGGKRHDSGPEARIRTVALWCLGAKAMETGGAGRCAGHEKRPDLDLVRAQMRMQRLYALRPCRIQPFLNPGIVFAGEKRDQQPGPVRDVSRTFRRHERGKACAFQCFGKRRGTVSA